MIENQIVTLDVHGIGSLGGEFFEEFRREACLWEAQALEFLRIDQPPGAIVLEDQLVFREDVLAQNVLRISEAVADDLEYDVKGGQGETHHDETALSRSMHEEVTRMLQMPHELAVTLGLALLGPAEHGKELARGLARQHGFQEHDAFGDALEVHVKIGARKAEHNADLVFGEH